MKVKYVIEVDYKLDNPLFSLHSEKVRQNGEFNLTSNVNLTELLSDAIDGIEVTEITVTGEVVDV